MPMLSGRATVAFYGFRINSMIKEGQSEERFINLTKELSSASERWERVVYAITSEIHPHEECTGSYGEGNI